MTATYIVGHTQEWSWDAWQDLTHDDPDQRTIDDGPSRFEFYLLAKLESEPAQADLAMALGRLYDLCEGTDGAGEALEIGVLNYNEWTTFAGLYSKTAAVAEPITPAAIELLWDEAFRHDQSPDERDRLLNQAWLAKSQTPSIGTWTECALRRPGSRHWDSYPYLASNRWAASL